MFKTVSFGKLRIGHWIRTPIGWARVIGIWPKMANGKRPVDTDVRERHLTLGPDDTMEVMEER